jgi:serine/threonine protein kinase
VSAAGYQFIRELGRGAMGSVQLVLQVGLNREVAIKRVLGAAQDPEVAGGLQAEARLLARLNHPHIVRVYELLTEGADVLMVMEYVPGTDLRWALAHRRPNPMLALAYVEQLAAALDHASPTLGELAHVIEGARSDSHSGPRPDTAGVL